VEQTPTSWMGRVRTLPRKQWAGAVSQVKRRYQQLKSRYGPHYTKAMVGAAFVALFLPIPGSVLVAIALVVVIAEIHRAISRSDGLRQIDAKDLIMPTNCDVILQWSPTLAELTKPGSLERPRAAGPEGHGLERVKL
jgi:hypothetical protein